PNQAKWNACAIVVAGGKSRRMGRDKSMLVWNGVPLIQRTVETLAPRFESIIISTNTPEAHAFLNVPMVRDAYPDRGPMGGIVSALEASEFDANFVVACDIPMIPVDLIARLYQAFGESGVATPVNAGRYEPLFAWYRKSTAHAMCEAMLRGELKLQDFLARCDAATVEVPAGTLANVNTPEDWAGLIDRPDRIDPADRQS